MAESYFKVDEPNDIELQLNAVPGWIKHIGLPILLIILFLLPVALTFIRHPEVSKVEIEARPATHLTALAGVLKVNDALTDGSKIRAGAFVGLGKQNDSVFATHDGRIHFNFGVNEDFLVPVLEPESSTVLTSALVKPEEVGLIKPGQKVLVEFDQYPSSTFGYLEFSVQKISFLPVDGKYVVRISRNSPWTTSNGREIRILVSMKGRGKLFIQESSILEKILGSVRRTRQRN